MLVRVLRNIAVFFGFDLIRMLVHTNQLDGAALFAIVTDGILGLLRPVELLLLVLLSTQFSNKGRGGIGFKIQLVGILLLAVAYLFHLDLLLDRTLWTALIAWLTYDWWKIPVAQVPIMPEDEPSK